MRGLKQVRNRRYDALARMGWEQFESLLADYYRDQGYEVEHVGTGNGRGRFDGGIDLKLRRDDAYIVVQCKHWNAYQVTHNAVHQLLGIMVNEDATGAILVSSGEFTSYARESAVRRGHVQLIDGVELRRMLGPLVEAVPRQSIAAAWPAREAGAAVGDHLRLAAADRIRGARRQSSPHDPVTRVVLTVLVLAVLWVFVQGILRLVSAPPARPGVNQQAPVAKTVSTPMNATSMAPRPARPTARPRPVTRAGVPGPLMRERTAAENREAKRQADEAAKVIEASTPQM